MTLFDRLTVGGFEQLVFCYDAGTGLRSLVAIHDTRLGPALGGVRMWAYESEEAAVDDCLRLAAAMTLKAAAAGLCLGGGASIVIADPTQAKTEALLRAHGRFIASLGGRFIPVNDVGTTQADMEVLRREASPVCVSGDPSPMTALGVVEGIRACLRATGGDGTLSGVRVAIQGVGNVGGALARMLAAEGARLVVSDLDPRKITDIAAETRARIAEPDALLETECDVLAPCALGSVIDATSLPRLRCRIVAGGANNVVAAPGLADALARRGILYAPDFCVNAGGLVYLEEKLLGHTDDQAACRVRKVGERVAAVLERARRESVSTVRAATDLAMARLESRHGLGPAYLP